jgi:uncharacterized protein (TIGR00299 family) protein
MGHQDPDKSHGSHDPHGHDPDHHHGHDHHHDHDHAHDHGSPEHGHAHEHPHHGHEHAHGHHGHHADSHHAQPTWREDLPKGAGEGKLLFLDAPSGLAGDMIIAALVDLGVPPTVIAEAAAALPISGFHLHFGTAVRSGIVASLFDVHLDEAQPERTYATVRAILDESSLPPRTRELAHASFAKLAAAEAKVHRASIDDVHFHEVGAVDALVDVVGTAAALAYLGAELVVSPLPMGRGFVKARHGVLPLPAPAVVECLAGFATYDAGMDFEFVTPTGAAVVAAHARGSSRWPSMAPSHVGWGAGTKDLKDRPNLLRAVLGTRTAQAVEREGTHEGTHVVIEANIDDATGELLALAIESLLEDGALDAWATPLTMKKGRPAFALSALATIETADRIAHTLLRETTSLGVRRYAVSRVERPRRVVDVATAYGPIPIKIAGGPFGPPQIKPELDACAAAARAHGVPVREVIRAAMAAAVGIVS